MKKVIKLTESDLTRIIKRVIQEQKEELPKEFAKDLKPGEGRSCKYNYLPPSEECYKNIKGNFRFKKDKFTMCLDTGVYKIGPGQSISHAFSKFGKQLSKEEMEIFMDMNSLKNEKDLKPGDVVAVCLH